MEPAVCFQLETLLYGRAVTWSGNTIELLKNWNDTCKLYFEAIMEADM